VSAIRPLGPYSLEITIGVVLIICYANLRGLREAGWPFAVATYSFVVMIGACPELRGIWVTIHGGL